MIKRRTTLKLGLYGLLGSTLPLDSLASIANSQAFSGDILAFFNSRYAESQVFGQALKTRHIRPLDSNQDLGTLWYRSLKPQLGKQSSVLFGMTDRHDLFCLEELARDFGMKTRFRLEHLIHTDGRVQHVPASPLSGDGLDQLLSNSRSFGARVDELAALAIRNQQHKQLSSKMSGPFAGTDKTTLVTWMIS
jgi:hypothetical protein